MISTTSLRFAFLVWLPLLIFSAFAARPLAAQVGPQLVPRDMMAAARGQSIFEMGSDPEISVGGVLVKRIEFGKSTIVISYSNRTRARLTPNFTIRLYDAYGLEISEIPVHWIIQAVEAGEVQKEEKNFEIKDLRYIFQYTGVALPADWNQVRYVLLDGTTI